VSSLNEPEQLPPEHVDLLRVVFEGRLLAALIEASVGSVSVDLVHGALREAAAAIASGFRVKVASDEGHDDVSLIIDSGFGRGEGFGWSRDLRQAVDYVADFGSRFGRDLADEVWAIEHRNYQTPLDSSRPSDL
jgi:hypothetical protein